MMTDLILAICHHLLAFLLAAALAAEWALVRPGLAGANLALLGRLDAAYGGLAVALIAIGVGRVFFGLKGWEFYVYNHVFWGKMAAFAAVALLSITPTMRIAKWRGAAKDGGYLVPESEIRAVRVWLKIEAAVFVLILVFAAAMARDIGY